MNILEVIAIAHICHDANRAYCQTIGDYSQPIWEDAPYWQKVSAQNGVVAYMKNPEITPADLHQKWWSEKIEQGWVYGDVKDADKKTHPCMVAYDALPPAQRYKDILFRSIVEAMIEDAE